jgi:hypothetical protein
MRSIQLEKAASAKRYIKNSSQAGLGEKYFTFAKYFDLIIVLENIYNGWQNGLSSFRSLGSKRNSSGINKAVSQNLGVKLKDPVHCH